MAVAVGSGDGVVEAGSVAVPADCVGCGSAGAGAADVAAGAVAAGSVPAGSGSVPVAGVLAGVAPGVADSPGPGEPAVVAGAEPVEATGVALGSFVMTSIIWTLKASRRP